MWLAWTVYDWLLNSETETVNVGKKSSKLLSGNALGQFARSSQLELYWPWTKTRTRILKMYITIAKVVFFSELNPLIQELNLNFNFSSRNFPGDSWILQVTFAILSRILTSYLEDWNWYWHFLKLNKQAAGFTEFFIFYMNNKQGGVFYSMINSEQGRKIMKNGSCHFNRASNVEIGVEYWLIFVVVFLKYCCETNFGPPSRFKKGWMISIVWKLERNSSFFWSKE